MDDQGLQGHTSGCSRLSQELNADSTYTCIAIWTYGVWCIHSSSLIGRRSKDFTDSKEAQGLQNVKKLFMDITKY